MKKMNLFIKSTLAVILLLWWSISLTSAANFKMNFSNIPMVDPNSISPIHFKDNDNDFWWFIYFSNWTGEASDLEWEYVDQVEWSTVTYRCKKQLKWFYYDSERWERLWALDSETRWRINQDVTLSWWLFTMCVNKDDYDNDISYCEEIAEESDLTDCIDGVNKKYAGDNWIYWAIVHEFEWQKFVLVAWVSYSPSEQRIEVNNDLSPTLKRFDNKFPVWFIYDANWWIGFVWCELTWATTPENVLDKLDETWLDDLFEYTTLSKTGIKLKEDVNLWLNCENIWSAWNSLIWLIIQWLIGMGRDTDTAILWNAIDSKMQYFSSANINNATLMNYSRERAESLCRWRWSSTADFSQSIICVDNPTNGVLDASADGYKWKTIIVKNWDVKVSPAATKDELYYDIFVGSWNLIIDESSAQLFVFKKDWFVSNKSTDEFRDIINSEIDNANNLGQNFVHTWEDVAVAALLKWNFIVNWWVKAAGGNNLLHKYFIHGKFTTKDTFDELGKVFKWRCVYWESNENPKNYCPYSQEHSYTNAFLVVIDQNYSSPLFW